MITLIMLVEFPRESEVTLAEAERIAKAWPGLATFYCDEDWEERLREEYEVDIAFFAMFGLEVPYDIEEEVFETEQALRKLGISNGI